jgi:hypothetical protein
MNIRIRETGAVVTHGEFRAMFPSTGFPQQLTEEIINSFGGDVVFEGPQAQPTRYQVAFRDGVEQDGQGRWLTKYSVADMDAGAIAAKDAEQSKSVRADRDSRLKDTDWVVIKHLERNENIPGVWEVYRQALRDVPSQAGFPWDVTWPVKP